MIGMMAFGSISVYGNTESESLKEEISLEENIKEKDKISINGLVSIETISNKEFNELVNSTTYGLSKPSSSKMWSLSDEYTFSVDTSGSEIYSNYMFNEHDGSVNVKLKETNGGDYKFILYKNGFFDTKKYTYKFDGNTEQDINMNALKADDEIYFSIDPTGENTVKLKGTIK